MQRTAAETMSFAASGVARRAVMLSRTSRASWPGRSRKVCFFRRACVSVTMGSVIRAVAAAAVPSKAALSR